MARPAGSLSQSLISETSNTPPCNEPALVTHPRSVIGFQIQKNNALALLHMVPMGLKHMHIYMDIVILLSKVNANLKSVCQYF